MFLLKSFSKNQGESLFIFIWKRVKLDLSRPLLTIHLNRRKRNANDRSRVMQRLSTTRHSRSKLESAALRRRFIALEYAGKSRNIISMF